MEYPKAYTCGKFSMGEAIRHSMYLLNIIAIISVKDRTPYEVFRDKKPNIKTRNQALVQKMFKRAISLTKEDRRESHTC